MVFEQLGRRLRLGVIGGGAGSFIGPVHRMAARLDGHYDIVASSLSSNPERGRAGGMALGIAPERSYGTWQELIAAEAQRSDRVDVLAVMTPNDSHFDICMAALDAGFHIVCDKPVTTDLASANLLASKVRATGLEFCVTYCYTGYPLVRQARDMVQSGQLGAIRQIHLQYVQGNVSDAPSPEGWRMQPDRSGGSLVLLTSARMRCIWAAMSLGWALSVWWQIWAPQCPVARRTTMSAPCTTMPKVRAVPCGSPMPLRVLNMVCRFASTANAAGWNGTRRSPTACCTAAARALTKSSPAGWGR